MIDHCLAAIRSLTSEGGGVLLLVGPPGIGKSTLARALQQRLVPDRGILVRATHPDLEPALGLWSRLASLASVDHTAYEHQASSDRFALTARLLRRLAADGATPVVLDDLHAADPDSLTFLAHLAPALSSTGATIIAASRGADAVADQLGQAAHRALESQARVVVLAPFDADEIRTRLERHNGAGPLPLAVVESFVRESGGNPLLLERLIADCWPHGAPPPTVAAVEEASAGPSVVERWRRELERLSRSDREVLAAVVELGSWASIRLLRMVTNPPAAASTLDRLVAHGLIAAGGAPQGVALSHPAVADALTALDGASSAELHERLARCLADAGADSRTVLHHMVRAGDRFTAEQRRRTARVVAEQAELRGDVRAAAEAWDIVVSDGAETHEQLLAAAKAWQRAGDRRRARELAWTVARAGERRDPDAIARAALIAADGAEFHGEASVAVALLHRARQLLERLDTPAARRRLVEVLAALAPLEMTMPVTGPRPPIALDSVQMDVVDAVRWHWVTRPEVAQPRAVEAEQLAARLDDPLLEAVTGLVWRATHMAPDHAVERRRRSDSASRTLVGHPDYARAVHAVLLDALEAGAMAEVRIALGELADMAATTGDPSVRWRYGYTSAMLDAVSGLPEQAERASDVAGRYGVLAGEPTAVIVRLEQRTLLAVDRLDDLDTVLTLGGRLDSVSHPPLLAGVLHLTGQLERAGVETARVDRRVLGDLVTHMSTPESREQNWAVTVAFAASAVAAVGDVDLAQRLLCHGEEVRHAVVRESSGITCLGHQAAFVGALQILTGDPASGTSALEEARLWNERAGMHRAEIAARLMLLEARRQGMAETDLRRQAHELAAEASARGLFFLAARARRMGRGLARVWVSPRQRAVLQGLADGATYQQIADRIGYSHGTVRGEVTSVYDLLGVDTRAEAVAEAEWLGLVAPSKSWCAPSRTQRESSTGSATRA